MKEPKIKRYADNPFISCIKLKNGIKFETIHQGDDLVNARTGEVESMHRIVHKKQVDETEFVKLYSQDIGFWFGLSYGAMKCFMYLTSALGFERAGTGVVFLVYEELGKLGLKMSKQTFVKAMKELRDKQIAAAHISPGWYWVNPNIVFKGNRIQLVKEYEIIKKDKMSAIEIARLTTIAATRMLDKRALFKNED